MIRLQAIGLYSSDFSGGETRLGDATIIDDGKNFEVIDGNCGKGTDRLISALKARGIMTIGRTGKKEQLICILLQQRE